MGKQPTGGVYTALTSLAAFLVANPDCGPIFYCVDDGVPDYRMKALPEYKEDREKKKARRTPQEQRKIDSQLSLADEMFSLLGCVRVSKPKNEADDIVAELVRLFVLAEANPVIVSSDHDMWQMVRFRVPVYDPREKRWIDEESFQERSGVRADLFTLYRALSGDHSDGLSGVPQVGEGRAAELLMAVFGDGPLEGRDLVGEIVKYLRAKKKEERRQWEENTLLAAAKVRRVMGAVDLTARWRSEGYGLLAEEEVWGPVPVPQYQSFQEFCGRLGMNGVRSNMPRIYPPFVRANKQTLRRFA